MPFLTILKALPWKDIAYGIVIAGLIGFIYHKGEARIEAKDTKVAVAAEHKVTAVQTTALSTETQNVVIYKQAVAIPAVPDIGLVCHAPARDPLPAPVAVAGTSAGEQPADSGDGPSFDPSGAAETRGALADAQITYLQNRVHELETEMNAAP